MLLTRHLTSFLKDFYANQKTALMLTGARQTGKTFAVRQLGETFKSFIEINFIKTPEAVGLFKKDYERHNALQNALECKEYHIDKAYVLCPGNMQKKGRIVYAPIYMTMFLSPARSDSGLYTIDLSVLQ